MNENIKEIDKRQIDYVNKMISDITRPQREEIEKLQKKINERIKSWK